MGLDHAVGAAGKLRVLLDGYRFRPTNEGDLQVALARLFTERGISAAREHPLSEADRVDFFLPEGVAVEVKVAGACLDVARQLQRYARHEEVLVLVLVTTRGRLARELPDELGGKKLFKVALGGGF